MSSHENIWQALAAAQGEFPPIPLDATNTYFKTRYATLAGVIKVTTPVLTKHGLSVTQTFAISETVGIVLRTDLHHVASDHSVASVLPIKPQSMGSAITYARRYALLAILGVCGDADDDGNEASMPGGKVGAVAKEIAAKQAGGSRRKKTTPAKHPKDSNPIDPPQTFMESLNRLAAEMRASNDEKWGDPGADAVVAWERMKEVADGRVIKLDSIDTMTMKLAAATDAAEVFK